MTLITEARGIIQAQFELDWNSRTEVAYPNVEYTPTRDQSWVRVAVDHNLSSQQTLGSVGNRVFRRLGLVFVQVFTEKNEGQKSSDELVKAVLDIFEGKQLQGIWFRDARVQEIGIDEDNWFQVNISIEFQYDTIK